MTGGSFSIEPGRRIAWTVLALALAGLLGWSAQAARRGWSMPDAPSPVVMQAAPAPVTPDPAPAPTEAAAPASGTTGTTALPPLPPAAALLPTAADAGPDTGIVAARPFALGRTSRLDRARAVECLTAAVYYEAASEPDAGQAAVAQVVLNRVRHPAFPATVCGVVYQGSEKAGCQFSFACDGSIQRHPPSATGWARAARSAAAALAGHVYAPVGLATHYHTYAVTPAWNRALVMTDAVGAHFFHRWKGWWGTPPRLSPDLCRRRAAARPAHPARARRGRRRRCRGPGAARSAAPGDAAGEHPPGVSSERHRDRGGAGGRPSAAGVGHPAPVARFRPDADAALGTPASPRLFSRRGERR